MLDAIKLPPTLLSIRDSTRLHHLIVVKIDSTNPGRTPFIRGPMLTRVVLYGRQANKMKRGFVNTDYFFLELVLIHVVNVGNQRGRERKRERERETE